jgi:hypothetical protein
VTKIDFVKGQFAGRSSWTPPSIPKPVDRIHRRMPVQAGALLGDGKICQKQTGTAFSINVGAEIGLVDPGVVEGIPV